MQPENKSRPFWKNPRFLVIALVLAILLTAAMGTMAWIRYVRSLQTVTLVHVSDHYLIGPNGTETAALNLGSIDVSTPDSAYYAFGVISYQEKYRFQLAYTTNIPFTYTIHRAIKAEAGNETYTKPHTEGGYTFYYNPTALDGKPLNLSDDRHTAITDTSNAKSKHETTFGSNSVSAQKFAEPVYWQSDDVDRLDSKNYTDYFIMEVHWDRSLPNDKETDMIYLTVGAPQGGS